MFGIFDFRSKRRSGLCALLLMALLFSVAPGTLLADTVSSQSTQDRQAQLEKELADVNNEIAGLNNTIGGLKKEGSTLAGDIKLLKENTDRLNALIKRQSALVAQLGEGIAEKSRTVRDLGRRIEKERQSLAQLIRKTNELDEASLTEMLLSSNGLSEFFVDLDSFDSVRAGLKSSTDTLKNVKSENQSAQQALELRQQQEMDAKANLERNRRVVLSNEAEKARLLSITKNKEVEYSKVLAQRKARAAEIRAALFALRDSGEIKFGQALDYANVVSSKTGIRPAFLLAIFQQESSFGKNQGSCFLRDAETGSGVGSRTGTVFENVMKPSRDVPIFMSITKKLGRDPYNTLVSCPQEAGYGGAMGAAQFIPSTWVMFEDRITRALGTEAADPWSARDAFMAAGLYLTDLGARPGSYSAERDAACRYFSGRKCSQSAWASTYGNQVMAKAANIQETMIDPLQNT